jgi:rsbT antagonist protein RsbS
MNERRNSGVNEITIPIVPLRDVLLCSLPATLTDTSVRALRDRVGLELNRRDFRAVVIDVGAVETMDSYITRSIRDVAMGAQCMGSRTVVCGLRPDVASTLVDMGMSLERVLTAINLDHALALIGGIGQTHRRPRQSRRRTQSP